ncbi:MAG: hypothetical protein KDA47_08200 [Planctomycetales bacterium]|nr:hypothetical protein [Planctomycetales bacterium]
MSNEPWELDVWELRTLAEAESPVEAANPKARPVAAVRARTERARAVKRQRASLPPPQPATLQAIAQKRTAETQLVEPRRGPAWRVEAARQPAPGVPLAALRKAEAARQRAAKREPRVSDVVSPAVVHSADNGLDARPTHRRVVSVFRKCNGRRS